jgi:putative spermidine/putrescine transport system substrate-binding protein
MMDMDRMISRRRAATVLGTGLAAPLFFVKNSWAEGKSINVGTYTGPQGEFIRRGVIPKFQSDYGCRVFQTEGVTLGQIAILRTQKANPTYSVMFMDDVGVPVAKEEDLIMALPRDKMPNLARVIPRFVLNDGFAAAFAVSVVSPFFNTQAVKSIESWEDLWNPKYQGRIMLVTPKQTQSVQLLVAATALATGKSFHDAQYLIDQGWDKMAALKPNVQTIYDNNVTAVLQISQGQADIGGPDFSKTIYPYAMKKAPVAMSAPKEGVFGGVNTVTLVKNGPNPDLGIAFADRMLDPTIQKALSEATFAAPTVKDVSLNAETAKIVAYPEARMDEMKLMTVDWSVINPKRGAIVEKYSQVFGA